jgi:ribonucleoside-diphosphate reductase alpha chain
MARRFYPLTAIEPSDATSTLRSSELAARGNGKDFPRKQAERRSIEQNDAQSPPRGVRHRLPTERISLTHHFTIDGQDGYISVGLFPDGQPGEIFINIAKEGSTLGGLMNSFAKAISIGLQYGVPLKLFCEKFSHARFEPSGWTSNPEIGFAKSIMDYIFRWLQLRFLDGHANLLFRGGEAFCMVNKHLRTSGLESTDANPNNGHLHPADALRDIVDMGDAPSCHVCGAICSRSGACFRCLTCGNSTSCG